MARLTFIAKKHQRSDTDHKLLIISNEQNTLCGGIGTCIGRYVCSMHLLLCKWQGICLVQHVSAHLSDGRAYTMQSLLSVAPATWAEKIECLERINSIRETNGSFDSCSSCKRLAPSRLHELHESKLLFLSRIELIRSKLSNFSVNVSGVRFSSACRLPVSSGPMPTHCFGPGCLEWSPGLHHHHHPARGTGPGRQTRRFQLPPQTCSWQKTGHREVKCRLLNIRDIVRN